MYRIFILLFVCFYSVLAIASSMVVNTYAWTNGLIISITRKKESTLEAK